MHSCRTGHQAGKVTSFADPPLTGQLVFQRGLVLSRLEKWTEYDSEADDDDGGGDRHCSITGRLMVHPSTQPLCVNATLQYLVFSVQRELGMVNAPCPY